MDHLRPPVAAPPQQAILDTLEAQDRVLATILSRVDQLSDRRVDYAPVCYVARPEDAIFVPYSAIVRRGGYLPSDISGFVKKSLSPGPPGVSRYANSSSTSACHPYHPSSETTK